MEFSNFIQHYKNKLSQLFNKDEVHYDVREGRDLPESAYQEIRSCKPLSAFIPEEYGGRGAKTHEALAVLEASSYESLPLSLMMGINGALFLQPITNYAKEEVKQPIFDRFLNEQNMGGLMITEPDYGSDALHMQTNFVKDGSAYTIEGTKHWQGLTGRADYWLVAARKKSNDGQLGRDISFFIHDVQNGGIEVEEIFENPGLHMLPYGRNEIDITVPEDFKLQPRTIGIKMMLDMLHRSRLQFPGMGMGFLKRILDEAHKHCRQRFVGGQPLFDYDQVKHRLTRIQSAFTICSAMCSYTSSNISNEKDVSGETISANAIKTVTTDMMHNASHSLLQLMGAKGYQLDQFSGRAFIDCRPFQIFEGSNDILYQQISEGVIKLMKGVKLNNLYDFLSDYKLTEHAADYLEDTLNFELNTSIKQRKMVKLGEALSRLISLQLTLKLGEKGFNQKLITNTIETLRADVQRLIGSFKGGDDADVVERYNESSSWLSHFSPIPA